MDDYLEEMIELFAQQRDVVDLFDLHTRVDEWLHHAVFMQETQRLSETRCR